MLLTVLSRRFKFHLKYVVPLARVYYSNEIRSPRPHQTSGSPVLTKPRDVATVELIHQVKPIVGPSVPVIPVASKAVKSLVKKKEEWRDLKWELKELPKLYLKLSKIRLTSLVVITAMGGYALAPAPFDPTSFLFCSLGTGLFSCAANSINQFLEVPFDAQMSRTKNRVLVKGYLPSIHALGFAAVASTAGFTTLYLGTNTLTAVLGASNLILYTMIYTPMKRISIANTWIGSIVGAIPPLMGWAACEGALGPGAWIMAGILYAWQFPHFNALSWNLRPDYSRAGYRMMSVTNPGLCKRTALRYTLGINGLCLAAPMLDVTSWYFAAASTPLNLYFTYLAYQFSKEADSSSSRKLFRFSLIHLPVLMTLLLLTKKHWFVKNSQDGGRVSSQVIAIPPTVGVLS